MGKEMKKVLGIESCWDCKHRSDYNGGMDLCSLAKTHKTIRDMRVIPDADTIPEWCLLPNESEPIRTLVKNICKGCNKEYVSINGPDVDDYCCEGCEDVNGELLI